MKNLKSERALNVELIYPQGSVGVIKIVIDASLKGTF